MESRLRSRAWDFINSRMVYSDDGWYLYGKGEICEYHKNCGEYIDNILIKKDFGVFNGCTGLKDKNEKLIYESDWIKLTCGELNKLIMPVVWDEQEAQFNLKHPKGYHGRFGFTTRIINSCDEFEVIGNIHQNLKLLKSNE